jgi:hypothetical protein
VRLDEEALARLAAEHCGPPDQDAPPAPLAARDAPARAPDPDDGGALGGWGAGGREPGADEDVRTKERRAPVTREAWDAHARALRRALDLFWCQPRSRLGAASLARARLSGWHGPASASLARASLSGWRGLRAQVPRGAAATPHARRPR